MIGWLTFRRSVMILARQDHLIVTHDTASEIPELGVQ